MNEQKFRERLFALESPVGGFICVCERNPVPKQRNSTWSRVKKITFLLSALCGYSVFMNAAFGSFKYHTDIGFRLSKGKTTTKREVFDSASVNNSTLPCAKILERENTTSPLNHVVDFKVDSVSVKNSTLDFKVDSVSAKKSTLDFKVDSVSAKKSTLDFKVDSVSVKKSTLDFKLEIHVIACKRPMSTGALLQQLEDAFYPPEHSIPLTIHVDDCDNQEIRRVVLDSKWTHGQKETIFKNETNGLRQMWLEIFKVSAKKADTMILILEDDMRVSRNFCKFLLSVKKEYWVPREGATMKERRLTSYFTNKVIGVSLSPIRVEELSWKGEKWQPKRWRARKLIKNDEQYLAQVPSSWGGVYWSNFCDDFYEFVKIRLQDYNFSEETRIVKNYGEFEFFPKELLIPNSRSNVWPKSWKRFMVDFMYGRGLFMLYPSFLNESGYATTLQLGGEHTGSSNPDSSVLVPEEKDFKRNIRVSPLQIQMPTNWIPWHQLQVLDFHLNISTVKKVSRTSMKFFGNIMKHRYKNLYTVWKTQKSCFLDTFISSNLTATSRRKNRRYLLFEPQFGLNNQIMAITKAAHWAHTLQRTLVVPPLFLPRVSPETKGDDGVDVDRLFDLKYPSSMKFSVNDGKRELKFIHWHEYEKKSESGQKPLAVIDAKNHESVLGIQSASILAREKNWTKLPVIPVGKGSVVAPAYAEYLLGGCESHRVLYFDSMFLNNLRGETDNPGMMFSLSIEARVLYKMLQKKVSKHIHEKYTCFHVRNNDFSEVESGIKENKITGPWYVNLFKEGYLINVDGKTLSSTWQKMGKPALLIISPDPIEQNLFPEDAKILGSSSICRYLRDLNSYFSIKEVNILCPILEQELCADAQAVRLNIFSTFSKRIYLKRRDAGIHDEKTWWRNESLS